MIGSFINEELANPSGTVRLVALFMSGSSKMCEWLNNPMDRPSVRHSGCLPSLMFPSVDPTSEVSMDGGRIRGRYMATEANQP